MTIAQKVLNVYAPPRCISCGLEGSSLCLGCIADVPSNYFSRCFICGKQTDNFETCRTCRKKTSLKHVWVAVDYQDKVKDLIHQYKYERDRTAAKPLAMLLDNTLPYLKPDTIITHVPTATSRVRARGYDHSLLLAREFSRLRGLKHQTLLGRIGQSQQMGAKRKDRLSQTKGVYVTKKRPSGTVLIIDDVLTTGSTLMAVAKELKAAGARVVYGAVVAHHSN